MSRKTIIATLCLVFVSPAAWADEKADLLELKNTVLNLMDALVEQGVLSREKADSLVKQAEERAASDAQAAVKKTMKPGTDAAETAITDEAVEPGVVRVPYVPEFVKEEIREQVRQELRKDVANDVVAQAKSERWGVPGALPDWVSRIKWKGDFRLRNQSDFFSDKNERCEDLSGNIVPCSYLDFLAINDAGGFTAAGVDAILNTTEDRSRQRVRARLGMEAKLTDELKFGARVTTGNEVDPVSTNETLGRFNRNFDAVLDQLYLQYDGENSHGYPWLTLAAGRIPNPWLSTDLVWDEDLNFDGAAATFRYNLSGADSLLDLQDRSQSVFLTTGAFPLQEVELSSRDKWLFGAQLGFEKIFTNQSKAQLAFAYYDYAHITGKRNPFDSEINDFTAPEFVQKGNTPFDIRSDDNPNTELFALASDYDLINLTGEVDFAQLAPIHVIVSADLVRNIGFDEDEIFDRTGGRVRERTNGYQLGITAGWPQISKWADWQVFGAYKYLQRDAVLDAFTDSDFHLGGTDAEGWILGAKLGLTRQTWLRLRWLSADEIDGPPLGIDVLQVDLNAKF
ncbi:MAG: putative porin [Gammaproteobacteria bacterium]